MLLSYGMFYYNFIFTIEETLLVKYKGKKALREFHGIYFIFFKYRKIPIISAGLILFRKPFLGGFFWGGGGAYYRDDICV